MVVRHIIHNAFCLSIHIILIECKAKNRINNCVVSRHNQKCHVFKFGGELFRWVCTLLIDLDVWVKEMPNAGGRSPATLPPPPSLHLTQHQSNWKPNIYVHRWVVLFITWAYTAGWMSSCPLLHYPPLNATLIYLHTKNYRYIDQCCFSDVVIYSMRGRRGAKCYWIMKPDTTLCHSLLELYHEMETISAGL